MSIYVDYLTASELRRRGWTDSLIREFLPSPDKTTPNPWYRSAAPIRLYLKNKIADFEQTPDWQQKAKQAAKRKVAAAKAVNTKLEKLQREIESWKPAVPRLEEVELLRRACDSYNDHKLELSLRSYRDFEWTPATTDSDESFLKRITVNYLRHKLTGYEAKLARQYGKVGVRHSYILISRKIFTAISEAYPELAEECERQFQQRNC